jgi:ribosome-binding protein aMBF1 (putative translation factor)
MVKLSELRRQHPIEDQAEYDRLYAEADLAGQLAEVVYALRTGAGLTQTELARRMGTTQSSIARVETAGGTPTLDLLNRVGRATGTAFCLTVGDRSVCFGATDTHEDTHGRAATA